MYMEVEVICEFANGITIYYIDNYYYIVLEYKIIAITNYSYDLGSYCYGGIIDE